jgi:RNA polymerase sigma-70 factor (ECF subfamily)
MTSSEFHLSVNPTSLGDSLVLSDGDLIERLQRGEPRALGEVYDLYHSVVRSFAKRLVGEAAAAEDLLHEVFVSLPKAMLRYRGESSLRTFLIAVAINHARHHVRAAARRRRTLEAFSGESPERSPDPEATARRRELARALSRALDELPMDQRVAFVLCEVEERTSREAAAIVGAPEATVRTRVFHAKKKLRERLERENVG